MQVYRQEDEDFRSLLRRIRNPATAETALAELQQLCKRCVIGNTYGLRLSRVGCHDCMLHACHARVPRILALHAGDGVAVKVALQSPAKLRGACHAWRACRPRMTRM